MIVHHKEPIQNMKFYLKTPLQFSKEFKFIPLQFKGNKECMFQTPRLYVPYGRQINEGSKKDYLMISFQNKCNDIQTEKFLSDLKYIYDLVWHEYSESHIVNEFIKTYNDQPVMNIKLRDNIPIFNTLKQAMDDIPLYSYASFIVHLAGLWMSDDQIWFQWYAIQSRVENNVTLTDYAFKDPSAPKIPPPPPPPPPPPNFKKDKYKKMISLGIPTAAVNHQKQIDLKSNINPDMLLSVRLKKPTKQKDIIKSDMNGFEPPSLDSLQLALQKLRRVINPS